VEWKERVRHHLVIRRVHNELKLNYLGKLANNLSYSQPPPTHPNNPRSESSRRPINQNNPKSKSSAHLTNPISSLTARSVRNSHGDRVDLVGSIPMVIAYTDGPVTLTLGHSRVVVRDADTQQIASDSDIDSDDGSDSGGYDWKKTPIPQIPELQVLPEYLRLARVPVILETMKRRVGKTVELAKKYVRFSPVTSPVHAPTQTSKLWEDAILKIKSTPPASSITRSSPVEMPGYNAARTSTIVEKGVSKGTWERGVDQQSSTPVTKPATGARLSQPTNSEHRREVLPTKPTSLPSRPGPALNLASQKTIPKITIQPLSPPRLIKQTGLEGRFISKQTFIQGADQPLQLVSKVGLGNSILTRKKKYG
jgi:hypothetical protein